MCMTITSCGWWLVQGAVPLTVGPPPHPQGSEDLERPGLLQEGGWLQDFLPRPGCSWHGFPVFLRPGMMALTLTKTSCYYVTSEILQTQMLSGSMYRGKWLLIISSS